MRDFIRSYLIEELKKIGHQMGSNSGGQFQDEQGNKFYKKHYRDGDQAKVEALTGKIYHHMGIETVHPEHSVENGKHTITTKWNDDIRPSKPSDYSKLSKKHADQIALLHHGAVLTKNWDIVGLDHDNVMRHKKTGDFSAIDHGGAFHYRAQGGHKDYGPDIAELKSLKEPGRASGHVFGEVDKQHPTAYHDTIHNVRNMDDDHIHGLFKNSGLSNWKELHKNFTERKNKLLAHYTE